MTSQEREELKELRIDEQSLKAQIHMLESEIMDVQMRYRYLQKSKRGKGLGVFFSSLGFGISIVVLFIYVCAYSKTGGNSIETANGALFFSVTMTLLPYLIIFIVVFGVCTMVTAVRLIMDICPTEGAYRSAVKHHRTNIPYEKKVCIKQQIELEKEVTKLQLELGEIRRRLNELDNLQQDLFCN